MNIQKTILILACMISGSFLIPARVIGQYFTQPSRILEVKAASQGNATVSAQAKDKSDPIKKSEVSENNIPGNIQYKNFPVVILSGCPARHPAPNRQPRKPDAAQKPRLGVVYNHTAFSR